MAKEKTLHGLFVNKLKVLLDIETEVAKALPEMAEKATDPDLKEAFEEHLEETRSQAERVEGCLESLGEEANTMNSETIRGLVDDGEWVMENVEEGPALDAGLVAAARAVEHHEMAEYMAAVEWADIMGHTDARDILQEILDEEKSADDKLATLAATKINSKVETGMER